MRPNLTGKKASSARSASRSPEARSASRSTEARSASRSTVEVPSETVDPQRSEPIDWSRSQRSSGRSSPQSSGRSSGVYSDEKTSPRGAFHHRLFDFLSKFVEMIISTEVGAILCYFLAVVCVGLSVYGYYWTYLEFMKSMGIAGWAFMKIFSGALFAAMATAIILQMIEISPIAHEIWVDRADFLAFLTNKKKLATVSESGKPSIVGDYADSARHGARRNLKNGHWGRYIAYAVEVAVAIKAVDLFIMSTNPDLQLLAVFYALVSIIGCEMFLRQAETFRSQCGNARVKAEYKASKIG